MVESPQFFDPQTLARLQGLPLRARRIVEGLLSGAHRSPYRGFSIEFAEHREYTPGDDLRYVDWKVFGRSDKVYLKQFEEETNLIVYLLLDVSESMSYRGPQSPLSKLEYAQCAAATLAYLVVRQQDAVGLTTFDDAIRQAIRPAATAAHWKQLVSVMERSGQERAGRKTSTGPILHELAERFKKRGLVVVLSDLFDNVSAVLAGLKHLRHRRHDVIVLHTLDPTELDFPFRRTTLFHGLEGLPDVVTEPNSLRKAYLAELASFQQQIRVGCRELGFDYTVLRTDLPLDTALAAYLAERTSRT